MRRAAIVNTTSIDLLRYLHRTCCLVLRLSRATFGQEQLYQAIELDNIGSDHGTQNSRLSSRRVRCAYDSSKADYPIFVRGS